MTNVFAYCSVLKESFVGLQLDSVQKTEAVFSWANLYSSSHMSPSSKLSLLIEDQSGHHTSRQIKIEYTKDKENVHGLSPGHVYYVSLKLLHSSGASQTLIPSFIVKTSEYIPVNKYTQTYCDITST